MKDKKIEIEFTKEEMQVIMNAELLLQKIITHNDEYHPSIIHNIEETLDGLHFPKKIIT